MKEGDVCIYYSSFSLFLSLLLSSILSFSLSFREEAPGQEGAASGLQALCGAWSISVITLVVVVIDIHRVL